jgi:acid phosphatase family membrane protein YuiD
MGGLFENKVLISCLAAWGLAQALKIPIEYLLRRRWNWALLLSTGGMPSSHAALVVSAAFSVGLYFGFDTPLFAIAVVIAMVVVYDATGIRRQSGLHARKINIMIEELFAGHPISDVQLKEVLGHSPREVVGGFVLGLLIPVLIWCLWR